MFLLLFHEHFLMLLGKCRKLAPLINTQGTFCPGIPTVKRLPFKAKRCLREALIKLVYTNTSLLTHFMLPSGRIPTPRIRRETIPRYCILSYPIGHRTHKLLFCFTSYVASASENWVKRTAQSETGLALLCLSTRGSGYNLCKVGPKVQDVVCKMSVAIGSLFYVGGWKFPVQAT